MFENATTFNQNIGAWNVSNVTNMSSMFSHAISFNQPIGAWNVSNVTNMGGMFDQANIFNQPIGSWNVSNVIAMGYMFRQAIVFNQPIGSWNVGNVTNMSNMFSNASAFNQPIDSWNVSNVIDMDSMFFNDPMFFGPSSFDQPIGSWNVGNVTNMSSMFAGTQLSINNYDALLIGWSTIAPNENPLEPNVVFSGGNSYYCNGDAARTSILNTYSWTITDAGLAINCSDLATEAFDKSSVSLYPNPTLSVLNLKVDTSIANQHYTISDALGKIVLKGKLNEGSKSISVEQLSKGIYYLKVSGKNAAKFIKK
jgi:surface protein